MVSGVSIGRGYQRNRQREAVLGRSDDALDIAQTVIGERAEGNVPPGERGKQGWPVSRRQCLRQFRVSQNISGSLGNGPESPS